MHVSGRIQFHEEVMTARLPNRSTTATRLDRQSACPFGVDDDGHIIVAEARYVGRNAGKMLKRP
jgi:hypothetical protein